MCPKEYVLRVTESTEYYGDKLEDKVVPVRHKN